jgi:hypothetical protein
LAKFRQLNKCLLQLGFKLYACEVWVDSTKIKPIEVVYRRFFKSLLKVRKTTSTSIVLAEFGKFSFEHFAWGQAQLTMLVEGKKCWARSMKKWLLKNQCQGVAGSQPPIQSSLETTLHLTATHALQARTTQPPLETAPKTSHIHPTCLVGVRGRAKSQAFWCNTHNIQVGVWMAKLARYN